MQSSRSKQGETRRGCASSGPNVLRSTRWHPGQHDSHKSVPDNVLAGRAVREAGQYPHASAMSLFGELCSYAAPAAVSIARARDVTGPHLQRSASCRLPPHRRMSCSRATASVTRNPRGARARKARQVHSSAARLRPSRCCNTVACSSSVLSCSSVARWRGPGPAILCSDLPCSQGVTPCNALSALQ